MLVKLILVFIFTAIFASCAATYQSQINEYTTNITLVLDWTPNTNHTGFFVAMERGYFEEERLNVDIIQPFEDGAIILVATGHGDFGISFQEEVVVATNAAVPLSVVAVAALVENNTSGILSLSEHGITSFSDLEGRTFGSWMIPIYDEILKEAVRLDGGNPEYINFIPNTALDTITAITLHFDATWVFEGWDKVIADIMGLETTFIPFRDISPVFNYYTPVLITHLENIESDKKERFLRASQRGFEFAADNPIEAAHILHKHAPEMDLDILIASQQFLSSAYFSDIWGYINEERWMSFFYWLQDNGFISQYAENTGVWLGLGE